MKKNRKLFFSLMKSYIFFALLIGIGDTVFFLYLDKKMTADMGILYSAKEIARADYTAIPSEAIEMAGGWVEILNEQLQVVYVKGTPAAPRTEYSAEELYALFYDQRDKPYFYSLAPFADEQGRPFQCLVTLPGHAVEQTISITQPAPAIISRMLKWLLLLLVLFIINVYLYSVWTAKRITNPLGKIVHAIRQLRKGQFAQRLSFEASYELALIRDHFNDMLDYMERTEAEKTKLEQSKRRMLVDLSHDLKTPIATIQGYAKALQLGLVDDRESQQKYLELILVKSALVTSLVEDIFELAKLESPDYPLQLARSDFSEFIRRIAIEFYDQFEKKAFRLKLNISPSEVIVDYDVKLMYRAISNILSNALRYNPAGTEVTIDLQVHEQSVQLSIADNGVGIPVALKEAIFESFVRGDSSRKSDGGTGLGLAIAKKATELHGGELRLVTEPGKTMFQIRLKLM
ncbi:ATP-binding protein [Paenibacillus sp. GCM10027626]|uniref:HAMP domain-containing sensor histidine kinase n=1 Tax=Paenibacillus sp. GCM10027626 TaxID=3273411 RepID=UPI003625C878